MSGSQLKSLECAHADAFALPCVHDTCYNMEAIVQAKLYMSEEFLVVICFSREVENYTELLLMARKVL